MSSIANNKYKDALPKDTILRIKKILYNCNIIPYEKKWNAFLDLCYSVHIEIDNMPGLGVNGKGITRDFALASGYGELIERIQVRGLFPRKFGLKKRKFSFPDEKILSDSEIFSNEEILKKLISDYPNSKIINLIKKYESLRIGEPYKDLINGNIIYLPSKLLGLSVASNGLCAGNTAEEALIHGICEILEQYAIKEYSLKNKKFPIIPLKNIKSAKSLKIIHKLESFGYTVFIKDFTFGGKFPVIGLLIINKSKTKYHCHFGSNPIFEIAVERCCTELMQGLSEKELKSEQFLHNINWAKIHCKEITKNQLWNISERGGGNMPNSILFDSAFSYNFKSAFIGQCNNNRELLEFLLSIIKREGLSIYFRNLSYLGFPTYRVYMPGLSEIYVTSTTILEEKFEDAFAAKHLLNINNYLNDDLNKTAKIIERNIKKNNSFLLFKSSIYNFMSIMLSNNDIRHLDLRVLLVLIYIKTKKYKKSLYWLLEFLNSLNNSHSYQNITYYYGVATYLNLKTSYISSEKIYSKLKTMYGNCLAKEIINDIKSENIFQHMNVPSCPDCNECVLSESCLYQKWEDITNILIKKMKRFYLK